LPLTRLSTDLFRTAGRDINVNNSLPGNKKDNVTVIYTPWPNLKKDASMATGQVSFHDQKLTKKILVTVRQNAIINRLNKTKIEKFPDLHAEREEDLQEKRKVERMAREEKKRAEKKEREERELKRYQKDHAYDDIMNEEDIAASSNQDREGGNPEDDFF
jgi:NFACT protein RNA binding domain